MKIRLLDLAEADLVAGYKFYEKRHPGVGSYFLDSLYSDIESLHLYAGIHRRVFDYYRMLSRRFPYAIYYRIEIERSRFGACWTADVSQHGFASS